ncbi:hypothetical protein MTR_0177s0070 [Medicago truncatula]|uniref:Uncharacterized protein n=1 Tax=Medicago truncatula TaxID=3880 RepID=A0A072TFY8_MEDTR|nr:hypothetical protein MTR_0177s0070 [Medicago truncatula]
MTSSTVIIITWKKSAPKNHASRPAAIIPPFFSITSHMKIQATYFPGSGCSNKSSQTINSHHITKSAHAT